MWELIFFFLNRNVNDDTYDTSDGITVVLVGKKCLNNRLNTRKYYEIISTEVLKKKTLLLFIVYPFNPARNYSIW